jgi:hypothetical protein
VYSCDADLVSLESLTRKRDMKEKHVGKKNEHHNVTPLESKDRAGRSTAMPA